MESSPSAAALSAAGLIKVTQQQMLRLAAHGLRFLSRMEREGGNENGFPMPADRSAEIKGYSRSTGAEGAQIKPLAIRALCLSGAEKSISRPGSRHGGSGRTGSSLARGWQQLRRGWQRSERSDVDRAHGSSCSRCAPGPGTGGPGPAEPLMCAPR